MACFRSEPTEAADTHERMNPPAHEPFSFRLAKDTLRFAYTSKARGLCCREQMSLDGFLGQWPAMWILHTCYVGTGSRAPSGEGSKGGA